MELAKDNFNEYFNDTYYELNETLNKYLEYVNMHYREIKKQELVNPTNYCYNALQKSIKFCKDNNITYYGDFTENIDRLFMISIENYIFCKYCKAIYELSQYIDLINNNKLGLVKKIKTKLLINVGLINSKQYVNSIIKPIENDESIKNYENTCNILCYFDPKKNLPEAFEFFIPTLLDQLKVLKYLEKKDNNNDISINDYYYIIMKKLFTKLKEINDDNLTKKINEAHVNAIKNHNIIIKELKK